MLKSNVKKHLIITNTFGPKKGGIEHYLGRLCQAWAHMTGQGKLNLLTDKKNVLLCERKRTVDNFKKSIGGEEDLELSLPMVLTNHQANSNDFDQGQVYQIFRRQIDYGGKLIKPRWIVSPISSLALISKLKPDLIHAASGLSSYLAAFSAKQMFGLPYILYIYGLEILSIQKHRLYKSILKAIINQSSGLVGSSRFSVDILQGLASKTKPDFVLYPGVETDKFKPNLDVSLTRTKYKLGSDKQIILSVGRLVARKGFDLTIKALPIVLKKFPNALYVLCGQGLYRAKLAKLVHKLNLVD